MSLNDVMRSTNRAGDGVSSRWSSGGVEMELPDIGDLGWVGNATGKASGTYSVDIGRSRPDGQSGNGHRMRSNRSNSIGDARIVSVATIKAEVGQAVRADIRRPSDGRAGGGDIRDGYLRDHRSSRGLPGRRSSTQQTQQQEEEESFHGNSDRSLGFPRWTCPRPSWASRLLFSLVFMILQAFSGPKALGAACCQARIQPFSTMYPRAVAFPGRRVGAANLSRGGSPALPLPCGSLFAPMCPDVRREVRG